MRLRLPFFRRRAGAASPAPQATSRADLPTLTVVMPVFNVAPYVSQAILAVLDQEGVSVTLVVVDDGSTDDTWRIVSELARERPGLIVERQEHAGQGAARNRGLTLAWGTYLAFADGDDVVPPGAYAAMVGSLEASGSDVCLGAVRRFDAERTWESAWSREVHAQPRRGVTLEEYLPAIKDILACNRMLRRDFWDRVEARFPEGVAYEDHWPMLHTLLRAKAIDILDRPVYYWRARSDGSSTGQQKHVRRNLLDRLTVKRDAWERLQSSPHAVQQAWLGRVLDVDLPPFVNRAIDAGDTYRADLSAAYARYTALAEPEAWALVRGQNRVRAVLAAEQRWDEVRAFTDRIEAVGMRALTWIEDGGVRLRPDALAPAEFPAGARELPAWQSALSAELRKAVATDDGLRVHGVLAVDGLWLGELCPRAAATLELGDGAQAQVLPVELRPRALRRKPGADSGPGEPGDDPVKLGFRVLVPYGSVQPDDDPEGDPEGDPDGGVGAWLRLQVDGLSRAARIRLPAEVVTTGGPSRRG